MKPLSNRLAPQDTWVVPVSVLSLLLGFMIASAWVTSKNRPSRLSLLTPSMQSRVTSGPIDLQLESEKMASEVARLRDEKTKMELSISTQSNSTKVLNDSLQEAKVFAGLTDVVGPGLVVTLRDSAKPAQSYVQEQIIHDVDVLRITNELWNAGAEAIAINGHRVVGSTSIRCVGSTILVNNTPVASPVVIRAIGEPKTMSGALNLPQGVLSEIRSIDPAMVQLETTKMQKLQAFTGNTEHHFLQVPKPEK